MYLTVVSVAHPAAGFRRKVGLFTRIRRRVRRLWFVHASGRFDRSDNLWRASLTRYRRKGVLVTGTEAAGRSDALFRRTLAGSDWAYAHLSGPAEGEAYGTWDTAVLDLFAQPFAAKLTDLTWVRSQEYGGKQAAKVHALVLPLRTIKGGRKFWVAVVHMPLDNTKARAAAWVDCCRGLVDLQAELERRDPDAVFVPVGDFNKNLREHDEAGQVRQRLEKPLGCVTSWEGGLPRAGTHDRQVIDYALLPKALLGGCRLVKDFADSDHRGFRYRIRRR